MEIQDFVFALTIIGVSAWIAYQWVIKPEREQRRRKLEQLRSEMRRRGQRLTTHPEHRDKSVRPSPAATLSGQS